MRAEATKLFAAAFGAFPSVAQSFLREFATVGDPFAPSQAFIPLDAWLAVFARVLAEVGPNALFQVGQEIMHNPHFTGGARNLEEALRQIDIAYHKSHRKGGVAMFDPVKGSMLEGIGHYLVELDRAAKKISLTTDTPYPCPLEHGIVSSIASTFEPRAVVVHDAPHRCRMNGGVYCTFIVGW